MVHLAGLKGVWEAIFWHYFELSQEKVGMRVQTTSGRWRLASTAEPAAGAPGFTLWRCMKFKTL